MTLSPKNCFSLHGLTLRSGWPLPTWVPKAASPRRVDFEIQAGKVEAQLAGATRLSPLIQVAGSSFQLEVPGVARYLVESGKRITLDSDQPIDGDQRDANLFLFRRAIPALMLQRGYLPLDSCAVELPAGVTLLCGHSASGKSSLAAILQSRGCRVLGDDIVYLSPSIDKVVIRPGLPWLTLWSDVLELLELSCDESWQTRSAHNEASERFQVPLATPQTDFKAPKQIVLLKHFNEDQMATDSVTDQEREFDLFGCCPLRQFVASMGRLDSTALLIGTCVQQCDFMQISIPSMPVSKARLEELADVVLRG